MAKQVTDRQGAANIVASAAETHLDRLRANFEELYKGELKKNEHLPDIGLVVLLVARRLRRVNATLVEKSDAYDRELSDDAEPRERRDSAAAELTSHVVDIRATLAATCGDALAREIGLTGKTDVEPKAILATAKRLLEALKDPQRAWPKPKRKGIKIDPTAWIDDLERPIRVLEQAQVDVARELREAQAASDGKARAMSDNDDEFGRSASFLSALFRLLHDDGLAAKVRPSARRPGRVLEAGEPAPEDGAPQPAEGEGDD